MLKCACLFLAVVSCLQLCNASTQCPFTKRGTSASLWDVTSSPCPHASAAATDEWSEQTELVQTETAPNLGQSTSQGCKCKSACGASVSVGFFDCDWCYTEGDCGQKKFGDVFGAPPGPSLSCCALYHALRTIPTRTLPFFTRALSPLISCSFHPYALLCPHPLC